MKLVLLLLTASSLFAALPATDNFMRANENPIAGNWTDSLNSAQILSNKLQGAASGQDNIIKWNADSFYADQYSQTTVGSFATDQGPCVRVTGSAGTISAYCALMDVGSGKIKIFKILTGSFSTLGTSAVSATTGDVIKIQVVGANMNASKNGTVVLTVSDASLTTGAAGIYIFSDTSSETITAWEGGNMGSALPLTGKYYAQFGLLSATIPQVATSSDLLNLTVYQTTYDNPSIGVGNPYPLRIGADWWMTHEEPLNSYTDLALAHSTNGVDWTYIQAISSSPNSGGQGMLFRDLDGTVHQLGASGPGARLDGMTLYETHPAGSSVADMEGTWSSQVQIASSLTAPYSEQMVHIGSTYYLFYDKGGTGNSCASNALNCFYEVAECTSNCLNAMGSYSVTHTGDWAGWGPGEALTIFQTDSNANHWTACFVPYNGSASIGPPTCSQSTTGLLGTYSAMTEINCSGVVCEQGGVGIIKRQTFVANQAVINVGP